MSRGHSQSENFRQHVRLEPENERGRAKSVVRQAVIEQNAIKLQWTTVAHVNVPTCTWVKTITYACAKCCVFVEYIIIHK